MVHNESKKVVVLMIVFYMKVIAFSMGKARAKSWFSQNTAESLSFCEGEAVENSP